MERGCYIRKTIDGLLNVLDFLWEPFSVKRHYKSKVVINQCNLETKYNILFSANYNHNMNN